MMQPRLKRQNCIDQVIYGLKKKCLKKASWTSTLTMAEWSRSTQSHELSLNFIFFHLLIKRYEVKYAQRVGTEDVFLGLSGKQPGQHDLIIIDIQLPLCADTKATDLQVTNKYLTLRSAHYKLNMALPVDVHEHQGKAQFDKELRRLRVSVPIKSILD